MNWDAIGAVAEVIGALGVVVTLAYVAFQMKQNTRALRAATYESYAETTRANAMFLADHPEVFVKAFSRNGLEKLSAEEKIVIQSYAYQSFIMVETSFLHSREELIARDVYESRLEAMRFAIQDSVQSDLYIAIWPLIRNYGFVPEFVRVVDEMMAEKTGFKS